MTNDATDAQQVGELVMRLSAARVQLAGSKIALDTVRAGLIELADVLQEPHDLDLNADTLQVPKRRTTFHLPAEDGLIAVLREYFEAESTIHESVKALKMLGISLSDDL